MHTRGGVLGLDRLVEVENGTGTVSEEGAARDVALDAAQVDRLERAAERLAKAPAVPIGDAPDAVDAGWSEIDIVDAGASRSLRIPAGADAPQDVWEILEVVEAIAAE